MISDGLQASQRLQSSPSFISANRQGPFVNRRGPVNRVCYEWVGIGNGERERIAVDILLPILLKHSAHEILLIPTGFERFSLGLP